MSRKQECSLVDDSNEELYRRKKKAIRYVYFEITLVVLLFLCSDSVIARK